MPYSIRNVSPGRYQVIKDSDGRVLGEHATRGRAERQVRAIYAHERMTRNLARGSKGK